MKHFICPAKTDYIALNWDKKAKANSTVKGRWRFCYEWLPFWHQKVTSKSEKIVTNPYRLEDLWMSLTIGYESHNQTKAKLYFTESLTFRALEPEAVNNYTAAK